MTHEPEVPDPQTPNGVIRAGGGLLGIDQRPLFESELKKQSMEQSMGHVEGGGGGGLGGGCGGCLFTRIERHAFVDFTFYCINLRFPCQDLEDT